VFQLSWGKEKNPSRWVLRVSARKISAVVAASWWGGGGTDFSK